MQRLMADDRAIPNVTVPSDQVQVAQIVCIALLGASLGLGLVNAWVRLSNQTETTASAARSLPAPPTPQEAVAVSAQKPMNRAAPGQARVASAVQPRAAHAPATAADAAVHGPQLAFAELAHVPAPAPSAATSRAHGPQRATLAEPARAPVPAKSAIPAAATAPIGALRVDLPTPRPATMPAASHTSAVVSGSGKPNKRLAARHLEYGLVVYLRCDGLLQRNKRVPCPRDIKLETRVWEILRALPQCRDADPGFGQAELRLTLHQKAASEFVVERASAGRSLNLRAVSQCTGRGLTKLRSRLRSPHTVVMFRFGLS